MKGLSEEKHSLVIAILTAFAVLLIIGGFFCPPIGEIDGSVLTAVGEIFAFAALWVTFMSIRRGSDVKIQHGQTNVHIINDSDEEIEKKGDRE